MEYIKALPFNSLIDGDELTCGLWKSDENICEYNDPQQATRFDGAGECDTSGLYYGTDNAIEPKFCARHFYQFVVDGDGKTNYTLTK